MKSQLPLPHEDLEQVFEQVGALWEKFRDKRLFLTGGSGFFGSWLLETLLFAENRKHLGVEVWVLTRNLDRFRTKLPYLAGHPAVRLVEGMAEDFQYPGERMNFVIHSMVPDPGLPPEEMERWFARGTQRLLELAVRDRSEGFLLCSTGAVYQPQGRPLSEEDPLVPLDGPLTYGRIRRQVEEQCMEICQKHGIPLKVARGFSFIGPRLPENAGFAMADFIADARAGRNITVKGDGTPVRSYLHAADMTTWLWKILLHETNRQIFNVGSEEAIRLADLAELVAKLTSSQVEIMGSNPGTTSNNVIYTPLVTKSRSHLRLSRPRTLLQSLEGETTFRCEPIKNGCGILLPGKRLRTFPEKDKG